LEDAEGVEEIEKAAFLLPRVADPAAYAYHRFNVYKGDGDHEHKMHFAKGTTTLAFKFKGGVVVSVDSRSTQGPYIGAFCA
jgi:20S proteasome subunit beta 5